MIDYIILSILVSGLCIAVYLIAQFSTKETPFEQAVAEQRQKWDNDSGRTRLDRIHKKPKIKKVIRSKKDEVKLQSKSSQMVPMYDLMKSSDDGTSSSSSSSTKRVTPQNVISMDNGSVQLLVDKKKESMTPPKIAPCLVSSSKVKLATNESKVSKQTNLPNRDISSKKDTSPIKEILEPINIQKVAVKVIKEIPKIDSEKNQVDVKINKELKIVKEIPKLRQASKPQREKEAKKPFKDGEQVKEKKSLKRHHEEIEMLDDELDVDPELLNSGSHMIRYFEMEQKLHDPQQQKVAIAADRRKKKEKERQRILSVNEESLERLLSIVRKSPLSNGEIQALIDALLNKQSIGGNQIGAEWIEKGKQDPMTVLRKQLEESENKTKELNNDQQALTTKISELRVEINSERLKNVVLKKEVSTITTKMQNKFDVADANNKANLSIKIKEMQSFLEKDFELKLQQQKQMLLANAEQKISLLESALSDLELQKQKMQSNLQEAENQNHHSRTIVLESEQQQQNLKTAFAETQQQLQATIQSRDELTQLCQQYTQHISSLKEQQVSHDATMGSQLAETQSQLAELQHNYNILQSSKDQALHQLSQVLGENENVKLQVKNLENSRELLNQTKVQLMETLREKSEFETRLGQLDSEILGVNELVQKQTSEIDCLRAENAALASESIRPAAEGQENGDINHIEKDSFVLVDHTNEIHEEKISSLTKDVTRLKEEMNLLKNKNDVDLEKWEEENRMTRELLLRIFPKIEKKEWNQHAFLQEIEAHAAKFSVDNKPEIVEKIVEKIVSDPLLLEHIEKLKIENVQLLKKISSLEEIQHSSIAPVEVKVDNSVEELKLENKTLSDKLEHYQGVLGTTEDLLKSIQASVENEESVWSDQLKEKEMQLESVKREREVLDAKVKDLQFSLEDAQLATGYETELEILKEKLSKEYDEKNVLREDLIKAQNQLRSIGEINQKHDAIIQAVE